MIQRRSKRRRRAVKSVAYFNIRRNCAYLNFERFPECLAIAGRECQDRRRLEQQVFKRIDAMIASGDDEFLVLRGIYNSYERQGVADVVIPEIRAGLFVLRIAVAEPADVIRAEFRFNIRIFAGIVARGEGVGAGVASVDKEYALVSVKRALECGFLVRNPFYGPRRIVAADFAA